MFSRGTYTKANATGQTVYGSMYDYYLEQSYGHLKIEGGSARNGRAVHEKDYAFRGACSQLAPQKQTNVAVGRALGRPMFGAERSSVGRRRRRSLRQRGRSQHRRRCTQKQGSPLVIHAA